MAKKVLVVVARFYNDIADELLEGAVIELEKNKVNYEVVEVPGAFEIPAAIKFAIGGKKYAGFVALGCVIRGETTHYDYVCQESARGLQHLALEFSAAIGNGIITVENREQAMARALKSKKNKGGGAALACITMMKLKKRFSK